MFLSQAELDKMLKANPALKVSSAKKSKQKISYSESDLSQLLAEENKRGNKYRNIKVYVYESGFVSLAEKAPQYGKPVAVFDSKKEYYRYLQLSLLQKSGRIENLERQKRLLIQEAFTCKSTGENIRQIDYVADFIYSENGKTVVEDVKGKDLRKERYIVTQAFLLKWKLLKCRYPDYEFRIF